MEEKKEITKDSIETRRLKEKKDVKIKNKEGGWAVDEGGRGGERGWKRDVVGKGVVGGVCEKRERPWGRESARRRGENRGWSGKLTARLVMDSGWVVC